MIASNGGAPRHPAWFLNLQATPRAMVQDGSKRVTVVAREVSGAERDRLWALIIQMDPVYNVYQRRTTRRIPVVILDAGTAPEGIRPGPLDRA